MIRWALRKDTLVADDRERLEELMQSGTGHFLSHVLDLDFALEKGFNIRLEEIDCETFRALQILTEERNKYTAEQSKKPAGT